ncbi:class I SAM-dependent methyltransferase [Pseudarthrobacter sp. AB1]|uniref:class I SAM-dependent methyltransferase n=1 Tax=Pseudarthrobacter sp. AB1 TaxID=2138309 RepID=UPI00186B6E6B|nr:class I SAM-dependent methyltransferase [Pseudarthrobacter sp. AB1]
MPSRAKKVLSALRQYLILPKLIRLSISAPKNRTVAWDRYWAGIARTGARSDVLWDSGTDHELLGYGDVLRRHFDPGLPVVDVGCGHGAFSRALTAFSPKVLGVDVSAHAVARARDESAGVDGVSYLACDMTEPGAGASLVESTDANVFVRGVLHVLAPAEQAALMENLRQLVGARGTVFLAETNFQGNPVEYVAHLGASLRSIPAPLELAIRKLPMPGRFGPEELASVMPKDRWTLVEDGAASIETNPLIDEAGNSRIPGYFAVLKPKSSDAGRPGSSWAVRIPD